jgi:pimeloyl-ACP methyl ester carboxylesterase
MPFMWRRSSGQIGHLAYLSCCAPLPGQSVVEMMGEGAHGDHPDQVGWPLDPATNERLIVRRLAFCNDMTPEQAEAFMTRPVNDQWPLQVTFAAHWDYDDLAAAHSTYILCERDNILTPEWQRRFADRLHCQRTIAFDAGHQAMTTQPDRLADLLLAEFTG